MIKSQTIQLLDRMKARFDACNRREQLLITAFLVVGSLWWLLEWIEGLGETLENREVAMMTLENQQLWLDQEAEYDERLGQVLSSLDASKTYSGNQLLEVMDKIARQVDLETSITRPTTRRGEVFTEHVLVVPISRASMRTMIDFENLIKTHYPYLGIDYLLLEPEPSNPALLRGEMRVTSYELNPGGNTREL